MDERQEEELLETISRLEARLAALEASDGGGHSGEALAESLHLKVNELSDAVTDYIKAHPVRSATIAFLLGLVLASRRGGR